MLRHPARHYIYYLFSKRSLRVSEIVDHLGELLMPLPREEKAMVEFLREMLRERDKSVPPPGFNPLDDELNEQTLRYLHKWKIYDMWRKDPFTAQAADILFAPQVRYMVETLLLGPLNFRDIARLVAERFGLPPTAMNTQVIRAYSHYYWDYTALDQNDWVRLTTGWMGYNQNYRMSLLTSRDAQGAAMSIYLADREGGGHFNKVAFFTLARNSALKMFMEHVLAERPSLARTNGAYLAFQMMAMAEDKLELHRGGTAELLEEFRRIDVKYDPSRVTTVHELPIERQRLPSVIDVEGESSSQKTEKEDPQ